MVDISDCHHFAFTAVYRYKLCISKGYTQYESLSFPDVDQEYRSSSPKYKVQEFLKHGCFGYWKTVYIKSTVLLHNWSHGLYNVSALNAGHKEPITAMSLKGQEVMLNLNYYLLFQMM